MNGSEEAFSQDSCLELVDCDKDIRGAGAAKFLVEESVKLGTRCDGRVALPAASPRCITDGRYRLGIANDGAAASPLPGRQHPVITRQGGGSTDVNCIVMSGIQHFIELLRLRAVPDV